jgi:eukaryotic-like serine/threonine-protein kinase
MEAASARANIPPRMKLDSPMPSFEGATQWLNQATPNAREANGRPTLVHFWAINSKVSETNLPHVVELRDRRKREGLRVIAVHLPRREEERDTRAVRDTIARVNLTEPCALDNEHKLREAFLNEQGSVPAYFLFDPQRRLRSFSTGEGGLEIIEDELDRMLLDLRGRHPFCPECELFLDEDALYCSECGLPLTLPGSRGTHPYYEKHHSASLPTVRLVNPDPLIGRIIEGKYELTDRVGEGGMSVVYRARRVHIGDQVAVKVLLRKFAKDDDALARFRREAGAAAISHHPNVITIHDFGETDDGNVPAFIVMEFVRGTPLRDLLQSEDHFPVERARRLMRVICAGVGAAHRQGLVHRDLKPENILVVAPDDDSEFESVRVVDFGFAKLMTDVDAGPTGTVVGTLFYMSPEQCLGQPLDSRSDVYSLGATFYEMLSGRRPFASEKVSGIINNHLYEAPPPFPTSLAIPRRISAAIMNALAKDPGDRPQTATDLARQLQLI